MSYFLTQNNKDMTNNKMKRHSMVPLFLLFLVSCNGIIQQEGLNKKGQNKGGGTKGELSLIPKWDIEMQKFAYINVESGKFEIWPTYDYAYPFSENIATVKFNNLYTIINKKGKRVTDKWFDKIGYFKNGFSIVKKRGKEGVLNKKGTVIVPTKYESIYDFNEFGYAVFTKKVDGALHSGVLDTNGIEVMPATYEGVELANKTAASFASFVSIYHQEKSAIYDFKAKKFILPFKEGVLYHTPSANGLMLVQLFKTEKAYFINIKGENVFNTAFVSAEQFREDLAWVETNNEAYVINGKGEKVVEVKGFSGDEFFHGYCSINPFPYLGEDPTYSLINKKGEKVYSGKVDYIGEYEDGFFMIEKHVSDQENAEKISVDGSVYGYIDENGKEIISLKWASARYIDDGVFLVTDAEGYNSYYYKDGTLYE